MRLSTKTRYGVRLMLELALNYERGYTLLKNIARQEDISEKYLSQIIIPLKSAGLVKATRGARGGYILARAPKEITIKDLVDALEGDNCLVDCVKDGSACPRSVNCVARELWSQINGQLEQSLTAITLEDLVKRHGDKLPYQFVYTI